MTESFKEIIKKYERNDKLIQARVRQDLASSANKIRKSHDMSWSDVINACLEKFVKEMRTK